MARGRAHSVPSFTHLSRCDYPQQWPGLQAALVQYLERCALWPWQAWQATSMASMPKRMATDTPKYIAKKLRQTIRLSEFSSLLGGDFSGCKNTHKKPVLFRQKGTVLFTRYRWFFWEPRKLPVLRISYESESHWVFYLTHIGVCVKSSGVSCFLYHNRY